MITTRLLQRGNAGRTDWTCLRSAVVTRIKCDLQEFPRSWDMHFSNDLFCYEENLGHSLRWSWCNLLLCHIHVYCKIIDCLCASVSENWSRVCPSHGWSAEVVWEAGQEGDCVSRPLPVAKGNLCGQRRQLSKLWSTSKHQVRLEILAVT